MWWAGTSTLRPSVPGFLFFLFIPVAPHRNLPYHLIMCFNSFVSLTLSSRLSVLETRCFFFFFLPLLRYLTWGISLTVSGPQLLPCKMRLMIDRYITVWKRGPIQVVISGYPLTSPNSMISVILPFWSWDRTGCPAGFELFVTAIAENVLWHLKSLKLSSC